MMGSGVHHHDFKNTIRSTHPKADHKLIPHIHILHLKFLHHYTSTKKSSIIQTRPMHNRMPHIRKGKEQTRTLELRSTMTNAERFLLSRRRLILQQLLDRERGTIRDK
jgi:hypothetical protein